MKRKSYDKQYKLATIRMIVEDDIPVKSVAKEFEIRKLQKENKQLKEELELLK